MRRFGWILGFTLCAAMMSAPAHAATAWRNNALSLSLGWNGLDSSFGVVNSTTQGLTNWGGVNDQFTLDLGTLNALGYNTWVSWTVGFGVGSGNAAPGVANAPTVSTLNTAIGIRYNFLDEDHRPYIAFYFQYMHMFSNQLQFTLQNIGLGGTGAWFGARAGFGYEWIFYDEMGLQFEITPIAWFTWYDSPKIGAMGKVTYNVYIF